MYLFYHILIIFLFPLRLLDCVENRIKKWLQWWDWFWHFGGPSLTLALQEEGENKRTRSRGTNDRLVPVASISFWDSGLNSMLGFIICGRTCQKRMNVCERPSATGSKIQSCDLQKIHVMLYWQELEELRGKTQVQEEDHGAVPFLPVVFIWLTYRRKQSRF